ncbi:MAG TPA: ferrous iron transport protein A [Rhodobacteraceae bacterium]|nr:ferrous iron transport protein A [Paracoccaceae bacterium]
MMNRRHSADKALPLALAGEGEHVRIHGLKGGKGLTRRLMDLGLALGSEVRIIQRRPGGAMIVARGNLRVALGAGMAQKVMVTISPPEKPRDDEMLANGAAA